MVSRAPLAKLEAFRQRMGWNVPWYSSSGSDFNYDLSTSPSTRPWPRSSTTNGTLASSDRTGKGGPARCTALSAFLRRGDRVFCTYSSYARGTDIVNSTYQWT